MYDLSNLLARSAAHISLSANMQALEAADKLLLTREAIVGVAAKHGLLASFVPKMSSDAAGCGCHCHFSLWRVRRFGCIKQLVLYLAQQLQAIVGILVCFNHCLGGMLSQISIRSYASMGMQFCPL